MKDKEWKNFSDNRDEVSFKITKNNIKELIEEDEETSFHLLS